MNTKSQAAILAIGLTLVLSSCFESNEPDHLGQWKKEVAAIKARLTEQNLNATIEARTGIAMVVTDTASGLPAIYLNKVDVDYTGKLFSNGSTFDNGNVKEQLQAFIEGWGVALTSLPEGSKATVFIPSAFAYGDRGQGPVPPNETLVFDIEFNNIVLSSTEIERFKSDTTAIDTYLSGKTINAITDPSGVRYVINEPGVGNPPSIFQPLKLKYSIKTLAADNITAVSVDGAPSETFSSRAVDYIPAMVAGLRKIGKGGKITLYVPSGLAFGTAGAGSGGVLVVPGNANIIVDVELVDIVN